ncbi:MAG: hypothetical protein R3Y35_13600 [Clostridia bacterium]
MTKKNNRFVKTSRKTIKNRKLSISLIAIIMVLSSTVALTLAYRTDITTALVNTFNPASIEVDVEEDFDNITKTNVTATNSEESDTDVYVRLKFVVQTLEWVDEDGDGEYDENETGDIVATPSSFDEYGYLLNLPITILNVLDITGLNVDFTGSGQADWFTDATESTGIYYYKYSLAPGESAYDLATGITQEVYYDGVVVRLTVLVDSIQVDGVEDAWGDVNQSGNTYSYDEGNETITVDEDNQYVDANGNPILYSSTYTDENGGTGVPPYEDYTEYTQRFNDENETEDTYDTTQGVDSFDDALTMKFPTDTTIE